MAQQFLIMAPLIVIARWLGVTPGWLLFGDEPIPEHIDRDTENVIMISQDLLEYVLLSANHYASQFQLNRVFGSFLLALLIDITAMKADIQTSKQAVDLAFKGLRAQHGEQA